MHTSKRGTSTFKSQVFQSFLRLFGLTKARKEDFAKTRFPCGHIRFLTQLITNAVFPVAFFFFLSTQYYHAHSNQTQWILLLLHQDKILIFFFLNVQLAPSTRQSVWRRRRTRCVLLWRMHCRKCRSSTRRTWQSWTRDCRPSTRLSGTLFISPTKRKPTSARLSCSTRFVSIVLFFFCYLFFFNTKLTKFTQFI